MKIFETTGCSTTIRSPATGHRRCAAVIAVVFAIASHARAEEPLVRITRKKADHGPEQIEGKILVTAADGGLLLISRDGQLWNVTPEQLIKQTTTDEPFQFLSADEMGRQLRAELAPSEGTFDVVQTKHYIICGNAGRTYLRWCGALFEKLLKSFRSYWSRDRVKLPEPALPLTVIVFSNPKQFAEYARRDANPSTARSKGYYSARTNRVALYDLTFRPGGGGSSRRARSEADIERQAAASGANVATMVHEAVHQVAFNCGLHTRYADNPLWLTEGMAMYFESPDVGNWRGAGRKNLSRYQRFRNYARNRRQPDALRTLIGDNRRLVEPKLVEDAYAEAWAFTYFLIKTRREDYADYLERIAAKPRLIWDDPKRRLTDFQAAFDADLEQLDREYLRYMSRFGR